jgi:hypothetical protein
MTSSQTNMANRRRGLQSMLQSSCTSATDSRIETVGCPSCHAQYTFTRRQTPPGFAPLCDNCGQEFVARDQLNWLVYEAMERISTGATGQRMPKGRNSSRDLAALYPGLHHIAASLWLLQARLLTLAMICVRWLRQRLGPRALRDLLRKLTSGEKTEREADNKANRPDHQVLLEFLKAGDQVSDLR